MSAEATALRFGDPRIADLAWDKQAGLLPAIVQDASNGRVLMLGYMDRQALATSLESEHVTFFSRSKQRLWTKGEASGHFLQLRCIETDCDGDSLLVQALPQGPTCHLGRVSCFPDAPGNFLADLDGLIAARERDRDDAGRARTAVYRGGRHTERIDQHAVGRRRMKAQPCCYADRELNTRTG